jgi:deazaflavin-dependent oxidoreductase (nitroreductase family)
MSSVANRLAAWGTGAHAAIYRASAGRVFGRMGGQQVCLLTTTGRRSGQPRTTPLMCFPHGAGLVIIASNNGSDRYPAWYHNLTAHPQVTVQVGGDVRTMTARTATAEERAEIWPRVVAQAKNFAGYEKKTSRVIPVVILTPR